MREADWVQVILNRSRVACRWINFSKSEKDGSVSYYERGTKTPDKLSVLPEDVLSVLEDLRRGDAPVSEEYRLRAIQSVSRSLVPDDVADVVVQLALFGEVRYWDHADFIDGNMPRNPLTPDDRYAII